MDTIYRQPFRMIPPYRVISRVQILSEIQDYNVQLMNVPSMWKETQGEGVKVVILDTGLPKHVDIAPKGGKSFIDGYLEDKEGHGCVSPDTLVHTNFCGVETIERLYGKVDVPEQEMMFPNGDKSVIKDVRGMGLKTLSFDVEHGKTCIAKISHLHRTLVSGQVVKLTLEGGVCFDLTPWHPVPTAVRNPHGSLEYVKVRADMLKPGDKMIIASCDEWLSNEVFSFAGAKKWRCNACLHSHVEKQEHKVNSEHRCSHCGKRNSLISFIPSYVVTEKLAYLMGLIFTDGSLFYKCNGATITVASKDKELTDEASSISQEYGFGKGSVYLSQNGAYIWTISSKNLFMFLMNAGLRSGRDKKKHLPEFVAKSTREVACAFVAGMIDGDGCICGSNSNIIVSTKDVADRMLVLLNALGMRASIFVAPGTTFGSQNKRRTGRDLYYCRFSRVDSQVIERMHHPIRRARAKLLMPAYQRSVYRVKEAKTERYNGFFYDFTVEGCHTYSANGVFVSNTHVAGILAAISGNSMGVAGIAPACELYCGAVLGSDGSGTFEGIINGIRWAVDEIGARVINMSLGIPAGNPTLTELEAACNYAKNQGVTVVCAAGNEGGAVGQPGCYDSVLAAAAVDSQKQHADFSDMGEQIDFAAGGVNVYSTYLNNGYARLSGTSMASPALAGIATLIIADEFKDNGKWLTPDEVTAKLKKIAFDCGSQGFDDVYGNGIPIFRNGDNPLNGNVPVEPVEPKKPKSKWPCDLSTLFPAAKAFVDAAAKAESDAPSVMDAATRNNLMLSEGLKAVQEYLDRIQAVRDREG